MPRTPLEAVPTGRDFVFPDGTCLPVYEARFSYIVNILPEDVACATPGDGFNCGLAMGGKRQNGTTHALVSRTVAYFAMRWRGQLVAMRFEIPAYTRKAVEVFDVKKEMPEDGFIFIPIRESCSAAHKKELNKRRLGHPRGRRTNTSNPRAGERGHATTYRHLTGFVQTRRAV